MTTLEELRALARLLDAGAISAEEHDALRAELLNAIPDSEIVVLDTSAPPDPDRAPPLPAAPPRRNWLATVLWLASGPAALAIAAGGLTWSTAGMLLILALAVATAVLQGLPEKDG